PKRKKIAPVAAATIKKNDFMSILLFLPMMFCFGFVLCLFCLVDGFIMAIPREQKHQQCKAVLRFMQQNGFEVLIICKKVYRSGTFYPKTGSIFSSMN
ncbi:MAG: hypothetical protein K6D93_03575, partial [Saccharofermentans sp.]|nr:hypothetical protein [Saccharofermentans sp.]